MKLFYPFLLLLSPLSAAERSKPLLQTPPPSSITIVKVRPSPEPNQATLRVAFPEQQQVVGNPVVLNVRIRGYSLGTRSPAERSEQLLNEPMGQSLRIVIDDDPYEIHTRGSVDPFEQDGDFYQQNYQIPLRCDLAEGEHIARLFIARSYGESLKSSECFEMVKFSVGRRGQSQEIQGPILTYNEPSWRYVYPENTPVLLDFLFTQGLLAEGSYGVQVRIDGTLIETLYQKAPYYIYGLKKGKHVLSLTVVNGKGKELEGSYQKKTTIVQIG